MKKVFLLCSILLLIIVLSNGIKDGILTLSNDINSHLWLSLVGQWESRENIYYKIEFNPDGTFIEYYHKLKKGSGDYHIDGNDIVLIYDALSCKQNSGNNCTVKMSFKIELKTIILVNNESGAYFDKVSGK
jgi:hypothetical protein